MYTFSLLTLEQTLPLRCQVLRPHLPVEQCKFNSDLLSSTFHFGAFENERVVGVATFFIEQPKGNFTTPIDSNSRHNYQSIEPDQFWRLRGMATDPAVRGSGIGRQLLNSGIEQIKILNGQLIWCNARISAADFYFKQGFLVSGEVFDIDGIGPHCIMYQYL